MGAEDIRGGLCQLEQPAIEHRMQLAGRPAGGLAERQQHLHGLQRRRLHLQDDLTRLSRDVRAEACRVEAEHSWHAGPRPQPALHTMSRAHLRIRASVHALSRHLTDSWNLAQRFEVPFEAEHHESPQGLWCEDMQNQFTPSALQMPLHAHGAMQRAPAHRPRCCANKMSRMLPPTLQEDQPELGDAHDVAMCYWNNALRRTSLAFSRMSQRSKVYMSCCGEVPPSSDAGRRSTSVPVSATHWLHTPSYSWLVICSATPKGFQLDDPACIPHPLALQFIMQLAGDLQTDFRIWQLHMQAAPLTVETVATSMSPRRCCCRHA